MTQIYIALRDSDEPRSFVVGAFSTEELARAACQADENDTAEGWNRPAVQIPWKADSTEAQSDEDCSYDVVAVDLDVRH